MMDLVGLKLCGNAWFVGNLTTSILIAKLSRWQRCHRAHFHYKNIIKYQLWIHLLLNSIYCKRTQTLQNVIRLHHNLLNVIKSSLPISDQKSYNLIFLFVFNWNSENNVILLNVHDNFISQNYLLFNLFIILWSSQLAFEQVQNFAVQKHDL